MSKNKEFTPHYKVFTNNTNLVKVGCSYAGKMYYGIAKCSPEDEFDYETGLALAKARCDVNICWAKLNRSHEKIRVYEYCFNKFQQMLQDERVYEMKLHKQYLDAYSELEFQESRT